MSNITEFPPFFIEYAKKRLVTDRDYLRHRAEFGPEPIKSIAYLILTAGEVGK